MRAKDFLLLAKFFQIRYLWDLIKKNPFKISAIKATRFNDNQDEFNLESPKGEIETDSEKFFMKGNYGVYNSKSQILKVEGNVNLTNKNSLEFVTSKAFFDFKKELLFSNESVKGKKKVHLLLQKDLKF